MQFNSLDLTFSGVLRYVDVVVATVGAKWINRKIQEEYERQKQDRATVDNNKFNYLFRQQPHPLVELAIAADQWRLRCRETKQLELNQQVLKIATLGSALKRVQGSKGFSRLINRLKLADQFDAAAFEVELASYYQAYGSNVEFLEEGEDRAPDLKVTTVQGIDFWVECKCRDRLTERDKNIGAFWTALQKRLLNYIGPRKLNYLIIVKSLSDPQRSMLEYLASLIVHAIDGTNAPTGNESKLRDVNDSTGRFLVAVQRLALPDSVIAASAITMHSSEQMDRVIIAAEGNVDLARQHFYRNPLVLAFKNSLPSDKVTGILHGLKSAVGQLPEEGPGIVWIRVPDNAWVDKLEPSFKQAEALVQAELTGSNNQRVNAVFLMTRIFEELQEGEEKGLGYRPICLCVNHTNPRCTVNNSGQTLTVDEIEQA